MPRKNRRGNHPQARRATGPKIRTRGRLIPAPPVERVVVPVGKCYRNPAKPKLQFAAEDAQEALKQAQERRRRTHASRSEQRTYECPKDEGGCGFWHLTGATEYTPKGKAS